MICTRSSIAFSVIVASAASAQAGDTARIANEFSSASVAQTRSQRGSLFGGEWYVSWGYNLESFRPTDIRIRTPSLGGDFVIHGVRGHDEGMLDTRLLRTAPFKPQYSIRVGRFIDKAHTLAVELNYDHTKFTSAVGQTTRVTGTIGGLPVDRAITLDDSTFRYLFHNGLNHAMVNVVKRLPLIGEPNETFSIAGMAKAGAGVLLPHADNTILGNTLDIGEKKWGNYFGKHSGWWQLDGWTTALEAGLRFVPVAPLYIEVTDKIAYARMSDVAVHAGTAAHDLWMNEAVISLGTTIHGRKRRP
jgi:hypothetical protein